MIEIYSIISYTVLP